MSKEKKRFLKNEGKHFMKKDEFERGMYIIDSDYKILYRNEALSEIYPGVEVGGFCYESLAKRDTPCLTCPLVNKEATFYNPITKEWISAQAAKMEIPGYGIGHCVQFEVKQRQDYYEKEEDTLSEADLQGYIADLGTDTGTECILGGYCDEGFPVFYANERMVELGGYDDFQEMVTAIDGMVINNIHPDDRQQVQKDMGEELYPGMTYETVYRMPRKNGDWIWVVGKGKVIETDTGRLAILSIVVDMSGFMQRQMDIIEQNEVLVRKDILTDTMMNNMPSGYHRCKAEEGAPFLFIGDHFTSIVGWTQEEIETEFDNLFYNLAWPEDRALMNTYEDMRKKIGHGNSHDVSIYRMKRKGGGYRWVLDSTMFVDLGEDSFFQGTIADITDFIEKQIEQQTELEAAMKRIETVSQAKSTFLFNVSHDIRTPMNAIKGFAQMIADNPGDREYVINYIDKIEKSSDTLMQLLNDVLELSRIESGKVDVDTVIADAKHFMDKMHLMFAAEMQEKGIEFEVLNNVQDVSVWADELKCTRIIMNMLSNAKKFTPPGGKITLGCEEVEKDEETVTYHFWVKDTGIGMSEEFQKRAFEEFEREKTSTDSGIQGSGLGLAIIRNLTELMGGTCTLESALNQGTTIGVTIKFELADQQHVNREEVIVEEAVDFTGKRVLLVEDNEFNREIAHYILGNMNLEVEEAEHGAIALRKILKRGPGYYDVVLMDIQMPVMDGYKATQEIRSLSDAALANIPIIAMTANAFKEDAEKCLEVGMNAHVGKPVDIQKLAKVFRKLL